MHTDYQNNFVRVQVDPGSLSINCTSFDTQNDTNLNVSCNVTIAYGENCQYHRELLGRKRNNELVSIDLLRFFVETASIPARYCNFTITAASGTKMIYVEGDLGRSDVCV